MLLRIEDTDRERSTKEAIDAILDGLDLARARLGRRRRLPVLPRRAAPGGGRSSCSTAARPIAATPRPKSSTAMREKARAEGKTRLYDGRWRDRDPSDAPPGVKPAIRIKAPLTGETVIEDQVQGRVTWQNENLDDFVLLRSDGTPTYMLAVVVDDHDMARDPHHPRRRPSQQRRAAEADLRGARLGRAGDGAHSADPRAGRLETVEAPWRARRRCLPRHGLPAGRDAQLSGAARLVRTATRKSSRPRR